VLDGLIGLPELSQLGRLGFAADGTMALNGIDPAKTTEDVALIENDPVVAATFGTERTLCRIDTGSNRTTFYESPRKRMAAVLTIATRRIHLEHPVSLPRTNQPYVNCSLGRDALRQLEPYTLDFHTMKLSVN
jgi:hypothetical protein